MTIIATWEMSYDGVKVAREVIRKGASCEDALEALINYIELNEDFHNVGYSGWPNEDGVVELDAAMINGDNLEYGAVASLRNIKTPISVARLLVGSEYNNFLVGEGAYRFAMEHGFKHENLLTKPARDRWLERVMKEDYGVKGHDTVGTVISMNGRVVAATSTSGLFMKKMGRVGDSPLVGPGLYADSDVGGATATGVGEDIIKGTLSFKIVELMRLGVDVKEACHKAVKGLHDTMIKKGETPREFSVVALDKDGNWGAASNRDEFPFVILEDDEVKFMISKDWGRSFEERVSAFEK